jgi:hypothetical protein
MPHVLTTQLLITALKQGTYYIALTNYLHFILPYNISE